VTRAPKAKGRVVTFFTNKGGVGKTTLSVNTAAWLAARFPDRVLLIDASIQMGLCTAMLNLRPKATMSDVARERSRLDETLLRELSTRHKSGLYLLPAPPDAIQAAAIDDEVMSRVLHLARRAFDFVVIDTFPMIDRVLVSILDLADTAYLVTESTVPILDGTAKMLPVLDNLGYEKSRRRLILNRYSTYVGNLPPEDVTKRMGFEIDFIVPYERRLLVAANTGEPFILQPMRFSKFHRALERIGDDIISRSVGVAPAEPPAPANGSVSARLNEGV
jgi:pilus assembly protein CpaE